MAASKSKLIPPKEGSTALTAVAFQDHLVKSLGLGDVLGPRHIGLGPAAKAKQKKNIRSTIDTGRFGRNHPAPAKKKTEPEKEYVLDPKPPPLTLAQKLGLIDAPDQLLSETDWEVAKQKSNQRDDSKLPCVICKEDFGTQQQVLLSCTHVFHRTCLQAFERFTGKKTCPMCRKEQYQTRVIHEGSRQWRHKCATRIQSCWRGYVVRCMYLKLRETNPPKDPKLRQKFYEEKLQRITDRMVRSCDFNVQSFLREMDTSLAASRDVFRDFDAMFQQISEQQWEDIQLTAVQRGETDCPICLTCLVNTSYIKKSDNSEKATNDQEKKDKRNPANKTTNRQTQSRKPPNSAKSETSQRKLQNQSDRKHENQSDVNRKHENQSTCRQTVLLSCSHVFHETCLEMFEELNMEANKVCPVCRAKYQKKTLAV